MSPFRRFDYGGNLYGKRFGEIGQCSQGWALRSPFQLAYVAFGISKIVREFGLAPASIDTQSSNLSTDSFAELFLDALGRVAPALNHNHSQGRR
jgi:hypothetical protein